MTDVIIEVKVCPVCKGKGTVSLQPMTWMSGPNIVAGCDRCHGTGKIQIVKQMEAEKEKLKPKTRFQILKGK